MKELDSQTIDSIAALVRAGGDVKTVEGGNSPFVILPNGAVHDLSKLIYNDFCERPHRIKQDVDVVDVDSFVTYFNLFRDADSRVFADHLSGEVNAFLDYHNAGDVATSKPRWGSHRLTLTMTLTDQWIAWAGANNKQMTQQQFAEFLEQNSMDVTNPKPAAMIDVANDLNAKTDVEFSSGFRNADGQVKLKYTETTRASIGGGEVTVPDRFTLTLPVYLGSAPIAIDAFLRYRCKDGKLTFWYTLIRPDQAKFDGFMSTRNAIAEKLSLAVISGTCSQSE